MLLTLSILFWQMFSVILSRSTNVCQYGWKYAVCIKGPFHLSHFSSQTLHQRQDDLRDKVWMRSSHQRSFKRLKDSFVMTFCFFWAQLTLIMWHWLIWCGPVMTDTCFWWQMHCPSSVIGSFFCVTCHVEARRRVWGETRAGDWEKVLEVITTFSTLLTDPGPGMIFARRSTEGEWAGKTWHKIKNTS